MSTPSGAEKGDAEGGMINPPVDFRVKSQPSQSMRSSSVGLPTRHRRARGRVSSPE
jgi:hypothetical protein